MITKEVLEIAVKDCYSIYGLARQLKLPTNGKYFNKLKAKIQEFNIDTSHFLGRKTSGFLKNNPNKLHHSVVLVKGRHGNIRENAKILRTAMLEYGVPFECKNCPCDGEWMGKSIRLEIHHIDEDPINNVIDNLIFLCPNCHSQITDSNIKSKKARHIKIRSEGKTICLCGKKTRNTRFCSPACQYKAPKGYLAKIDHEDLQRLVKIKPCKEIAKDFGVACSSLSYYCKKLGITVPPVGYWVRVKHGYETPPFCA